MPTDPGLVDARGLKCPLPVLRMEKRLAALAPGAEFVVLATDPLARIDIPLHCRLHGHGCALEEADGVLRFHISVAERARGETP